MRALVFLVYSVCAFSECFALWKIYPQYQQKYPISTDNVGDPLFVTPYLERGDYQQAQIASMVKPMKGDVKSHAGFITVNKTYNSNMFFWYFPAETAPKTAPVVVWLQGGPGASSLFGLFAENGPFYVKKQRGLGSRDYYWSKAVHMIYVDNPVGTGFSFTENDNGYARNEDDVGANLYSAIFQFFKLFPDLQKNDFFVTGESYAGKYVPAAAYAIHMNNQKSTQKINLKGIGIGNGLCDPENMMNYGDYLNGIGLIDELGRQVFKQKQQAIVANIKAKKYKEAFEGFDSLLNGDLTPYKSTFYNLTGFTFYFNFLHNKDESPYGDLGSYVQKDIVRRSIHVGNYTFHSDNKVERFLINDIMQSVKPRIETLLNNNYRVVIYNGQLDIIVPYALTVDFLNTLNWNGQSLYRVAQRKEWWVGNELAGYSKTVKSFTEILVRDAGHMVPGDQPQWAFDLISRLAFNKPF